jgi:two-component system, chemotaxis family, response regulator Rcp1
MSQETGEKRNVLLVGGDAQSAELIGRTLAEMGLTSGFHTFPDCQSALVHLRQSRDSGSWLILLDIGGFDDATMAFLETINTDPTLRVIPVVIMTTDGSREMITACYDRGAAGYLIKASANDDFATKIRCLCGYWMLNQLPAVRFSNPPS